MAKGLKPKVEYYLSGVGHRWRCKSAAGEELARGTREVIDLSWLKKEVGRILRGCEEGYMYQDVQGKWRFRVRDTDGKILAVSSESYCNRNDCRRALALLIGSRE